MLACSDMLYDIVLSIAEKNRILRKEKKKQTNQYLSELEN